MIRDGYDVGWGRFYRDEPDSLVEMAEDPLHPRRITYRRRSEGDPPRMPENIYRQPKQYYAMYRVNFVIIPIFNIHDRLTVDKE